VLLRYAVAAPKQKQADAHTTGGFSLQPAQYLPQWSEWLLRLEQFARVFSTHHLKLYMANNISVVREVTKLLSAW